ncbi:MAG: hypothetical protein U1D31_02335 [Patescibacteria group bacterium]|nr:hypothetical protein [bacterium]MDZ4240936.1 hypothetical protein [Patescibacteria group bacterium]
MYKRGFIRDIIIIVIAVLALGYFGFDIKGWLDSPEVKAVVGPALEFIENIWTNYIQGFADYLWNDIIIGVVWQWILSIIETIKN